MNIGRRDGIVTGQDVSAEDRKRKRLVAHLGILAQRERLVAPAGGGFY